MIPRYSIRLIFICCTAASIVLAAVVITSPLSHEPQRHAFTRRLSDAHAILKSVTGLPANSYYIAGQSQGKIVLGNVTAPLLVTQFNPVTESLSTHTLNYQDSSEIINPGAFRLITYGNTFYLSHGEQPILVRGTVDNWHPEPFIARKFYFADLVPVNEDTLVSRSYSRTTESFELALVTIDSPHFAFRYHLLEKQLDGLFCVEGKLHYSESNRKVVYLYTYRNSFLVLDPSLKSVRQHHTIDTFSRVRLRTAEVSSRGYTTLSAPPFRVNGFSSVWKNLLYIQSPLLSANESEEAFRDNVVIDVYLLETGEYQYSFYVPKFNGYGISGFSVYDELIIALFGRSLVVYNLPRFKNPSVTHPVENDFAGESGINAEHLNKPK